MRHDYLLIQVCGPSDVSQIGTESVNAKALSRDDDRDRSCIMIIGLGLYFGARRIVSFEARRLQTPLFGRVGPRCQARFARTFAGEYSLWQACTTKKAPTEAGAVIPAVKTNDRCEPNRAIQWT